MSFNDELKPLKSKIKKYVISSFDIETMGNNNDFILGGYYSHDNKYTPFFNKDHFKSFLVHSCGGKNKRLYATNLGFDFDGVFSDLNNCDRIMRGGRTVSVRYGDLEFGDTMSYSPVSVATLGKLLGKPKLKHPQCLGRMWETKNEKRYMITYNRQDCVITKEFIEQLQDVLNHLGAELKITIPSCAMNLYRRKYMPCNIHKEYVKEFQDGYSVKEFIFDGYYGGRTETFKRGDFRKFGTRQEYYLWDFNSLYPSCMINEYPLPASCHISNNPNIDNIMKYHGVSEVSLTCPYMYYPLLPHRNNGKLIFPIGNFRGTYNHLELRKAIELGYIINKVHRQIYYTKTFFPFKKWVNDLYGLRLQYQKDGNEIYATIVKLLLNSLYGKFGTRHVSQLEFIDLEDKTLTKEDILGCTFYKNDLRFAYRETPKECDQAYVIPILASMTTTYARLKLYDKLVELDGIYCDTDSIITNKLIKYSKDLGDLKLEKSFKKFCIVKPKHYYIYDEKNNKEYFKVKGLRLDANNLERDFNNSITGKPIKQFGFRKLKESLRGGYVINSKKEFEKVINIEDTKREWKSKFMKQMFSDSDPITLPNISYRFDKPIYVSKNRYLVDELYKKDKKINKSKIPTF